MEHFKRGRFDWQMLEMPDGITTSNGNWYHITTQEIDKYVPGLLKKYPVERIIEEADAWVKSSDGMALMLFFLLVYMSLSPLLATLISLVFYLFWYFNTGFFVNVTATPLAKILYKDGVIYTVSAILLIGISLNDTISSMGLQVDFYALWYGLGLFFLFKVGLLRLLIEFLRSRFFGKPTVAKEDRVLNMLLIRYGMKMGVLTGKVEEMENKLIRTATYHKERKK
jgi:hypothetical protein